MILSFRLYKIEALFSMVQFEEKNKEKNWIKFRIIWVKKGTESSC